MQSSVQDSGLGGGGVQAPTFHSYAYPISPGLAKSTTHPTEASWNASLSERLLPSDAVGAAPPPDDVLLIFLQSTYETAAQALNLEREQLERQPITIVVDGALSTA
uniref:DUF5996 family protein n=1 Tax=Synechococcus sp. CS-1329 TaxID=2847975 RepID=UPI00223B2BCE|nr:DUF5996 family protein [Synechococcus sp. CS-1329]